VVAGVALLVLGLSLGAWALIAFRAVRTSPNPWTPTQALALRGPYRFSRNPMYLGFNALYAGGAILTRMGWPLLLLPIVLVAVHRLVIIREEAYLERKFGQAYRDYVGRVRRWV
jgi:protein-S-isoprenylcysteine O-methyltransferase Ste14